MPRLLYLFMRSKHDTPVRTLQGVDAIPYPSVGSAIPCRHVRDLHPDHACKNREACLRPNNSGRSVARLTARAALCLFSPYCPPLALNRTELPEGSSCYHSDPIRYIVREASHQSHSARPARSRRGLAGIRQVVVRSNCITIPITYNHATSCRN